MRLADSLTVDETKESYFHLNQMDNRPSQKWINIEFKFNRQSVTDMHFYALRDWLEKSKSPKFDDLQKVFEKLKIMTCVLCEVSVN